MRGTVLWVSIVCILRGFSDQLINTSLSWQEKQVLLSFKKKEKATESVREKNKAKQNTVNCLALAWERYNLSSMFGFLVLPFTSVTFLGLINTKHKWPGC